MNEELDADWAQISVEGGAGNVAAYGNLAWGGTAQATAGSTSMTSSWERYRKAGAAMRIMLVEAAARDWAVPASEIRAEKGKLTHASGKLASYGEMATKTDGLMLPADIPLKPREKWTQIGNADLKRFHLTENQRHIALHHRRAASRDGNGDDDPSAEIRRYGQVL